MFRSVVQDAPAFEISEIADDEQCGYMVSLLISRNDLTNQDVYVDIKLVYVYDQDFWEFSFTISVISLDGGFEEFATQDSKMAAPYIPDGIRGTILIWVCLALKKLVAQVQPERVFRVTKGRNLPEKALRKHHLLTGALVECGYRVQETGTDPFGRAFWVCERVRD
jgi:hypothetical protein